jgi:tetratricopeptide (TPR) repeat protein
VTAARRLVRTAVERDSTLAVGWYYLSRIDPQLGRDSALVFIRRARAAAPLASPRDRLFVEAAWTAMFDDPDRAAAARRFVRAFPDDPAAALLFGESLRVAGDFLGAVPYLREANRLGAAEVTQDSPNCDACDAYWSLAAAYGLADSVAAAERVAREWVARQPRSPYAWQTLAAWLSARSRFDEAIDALGRGRALPVGADRLREPYNVADLIELDIRAGRLDEADRLCAEMARDATPAMRVEADWLRVILLRTEGRPAAAARVAAELRARTRLDGRTKPGLHHAEAEAQSLFEAGEHRAAAALFDSTALSTSASADEAESSKARWRGWMLAQGATVLAAAGDTATLAARADTIERLGQRSSYGRDQRLHHYVRGLLLAARGNLAGAVAEQRAAIYSPAIGYTRVNVELARALMALGRPAEAVETLQAALRGGVQASNLYVTRTELHEALADAGRAAGRADSARAHYAAVAAAWQDAEPRFRGRTARARLLAGGGG